MRSSQTLSEHDRRLVAAWAAAVAAARAAGQASAVCHMDAHALGAAAYAVRAASLVALDRPVTTAEEMQWQLNQMTPEIRTALQALPAIGENRSGPLGPGLLTLGQLGAIIGDLQAGIRKADQNSEPPLVSRKSVALGRSDPP